MSARDESARMMRGVEELRRRAKRLVKVNPQLRGSAEWQAVCASVSALGIAARAVDDALSGPVEVEIVDEDEAREAIREGRESVWKGGR